MEHSGNLFSNRQVATKRKLFIYIKTHILFKVNVTSFNLWEAKKWNKHNIQINLMNKAL